MRSDLTRALKLSRAQIGVKHGGRQVLDLLLKPTELHGGAWSAMRVITIRAGAYGPDDEIAKRARESKCTEAWGEYKLGSKANGIQIRVGTVASSADATQKASNYAQNLFAGFQKMASVQQSELLTDLQLSDSTPAFGVERSALRKSGKIFVFKQAATSVQEYFVAVSRWDDSHGPEWEDVLATLKLQRDKIRRSIGELE
jgi:hypothetical protein